MKKKPDRMGARYGLSQNVKRLCIAQMVVACVMGLGMNQSFASENRGNGIELNSSTLQQKGTVTGKVVDKMGDALPGVSVVVKGTTVGTVTDIDGHFSLLVEPGSRLVFSFIGMVSQEIKVDAQTNIDVKMDDTSIGVNEVVVVGYGTQKKSDITGSVTSVPRDRLAKLPVNNVMQAIQGVAAGVTVTQSSSIPGDAPSSLVRGRGSINADNNPYIVVDGIPLTKTDASINDINPNDIESVEILKDASAVAIYGTNGANGVILITTKRGNLGAPTIRYNGYMGVEGIAHVLEPGSAEQLKARYAEFARVEPSMPLYKDSEIRYESEYENWKNNKTIDWIDEVTQTGIIQDHNINISGGAERVRYYVSGGVFDQKGVIKGYNYKRYTVRTNIDMDVTNYMTVGTSSVLAMHNKDGGRANLLNAAAMSPYATMYNADGTYTQNPMFNETLWANPLLPTTLNPERRQYNATVQGYADLNFGNIYSPLKGLKFKLNAGYTYAPQRTNEYEGKSVYNMQGWGKMYNRESQTWTLENILTYTRDFGKHHFDFTGLYAAKSKYFQEVTAEASVFPNDDLGWGNLQAGSSAKVSTYADLYRTLSQMGRLNYSYDSRYLATVTVRRDGSSVFGDNYKYGVFPSVAFGWNIANEAFMSSTKDVLNNLKWRVSYGKSGNEAISVYQTLSKLEANTLAMGGKTQTALKINRTMGNDNLAWESTLGFNTGIDFGLFDNRINGSIDAYSSRTVDLLMKRNLPQTIGFDNVFMNLGETENKGIEVTINSRNVVKRDFSWGTTVVFAANQNKIVDLYGDGKDDLGNRWFIGQPIEVVYDYTMLGIWQEDEIAAGKHQGWDNNAKAGDVKLADLSGPDGVPDGKIDANDRTVLGQTAPKWTGGITNTVTYKGLSLSVFINTVQGGLRNNSQIGIASDEMGRRNGPAEIGYWTPENKSNEWRSLSKTSNRYGYGFSSDASYTRIKDVTLSYSFPKNTVKKLGIGDLQFYMSGRNLYTFTNWIGWDPEARDDGRGSGNWSLNYPVVRSYIFGVNITL